VELPLGNATSTVPSGSAKENFIRASSAMIREIRVQ
jgi:hypothetical protein